PGIQPGGNAVGGQHPGSLPAEQLALDAAVVADGHLPGQTLGVDVVCQALGGPADGVDVHPVGAGANDAPQPAGAEFQIPVEPVGDGIGVIADGFQLGGQVGVLPGAGQPEVQCLLILHDN